MNPVKGEHIQTFNNIFSRNVVGYNPIKVSHYTISWARNSIKIQIKNPQIRKSFQNTKKYIQNLVNIVDVIIKINRWSFANNFLIILKVYFPLEINRV